MWDEDDFEFDENEILDIDNDLIKEMVKEILLYEETEELTQTHYIGKYNKIHKQHIIDIAKKLNFDISITEELNELIIYAENVPPSWDEETNWFSLEGSAWSRKHIKFLGLTYTLRDEEDYFK